MTSQFLYRRRDFIGLTYGVALALPFRADAQQQGKIWRIGNVYNSTPELVGRLAQALEQHLADLGYVQGRNIVLLNRFAGPEPDKLREVISSLAPQIDILVVWGTAGGIAAKKIGGTVPTVFVSVGAPVEMGLVRSLAHPGGNMTGITFEAATETYGKRLQILKEIAPDVKRVAVLGATGDGVVGFAMTSLDRAAPELGVTLLPIDIKSAGDLIPAFANMKKADAGALIVVAGGLTYTAGAQIADLALEAHLPSCYAFRETAIAGGLVSLGPDLAAMAGPAAAQVAQIIKGTSPTDIPVEQPTRYELYINMKTARLLDLTIPPALALPRGAAAQQPRKIWRIGDLYLGPPEVGRIYAPLLERSLADLGYVQGRNIKLLIRYTGSQREEMQEAITSLLLQVDLLVVWGNAAIEARKLTSAVPTVFISIGYPVELGLVQSLAHPGGNMTGITSEAALETNGKRLQILKGIVPGLKRVAVLRDIDTRQWEFEWTALDQAAHELGLSLVFFDIRSADDLEGAFASMKTIGAEALSS